MYTDTWYDKVKVDGRVYCWDESRNDMVELAKNVKQKVAPKEAGSEARITGSQSRQVSSS